jgi:histidinol phosphatase-like PHP family hydrolase
VQKFFIIKMLDQDLHIHTTFSVGDTAVVPQQTIAFIAAVKHARIIGISDHFDYITDTKFDEYRAEVTKHGLLLGTEVDGANWADEAVTYPFDYYIYHCYDYHRDYRAAELLLTTGKPVIIAHPQALDTNLNKVPTNCLIEINNRYVWRFNWRQYYTPFVGKFRFVLGSDAHQPNWLTHSIAEYVARELGVENTLLF